MSTSLSASEISDRCHTVSWLIRQYERAVREAREAKQDFEELDENVTEFERVEWIELMRKANAERVLNPKVMDVYNVRLPEGTYAAH